MQQPFTAPGSPPAARLLPIDHRWSQSREFPACCRQQLGQLPTAMPSAARTEWIRRSLIAIRRAWSTGGIWIQCVAKWSRFDSNWVRVATSINCSRWSRFNAEAHSTKLPHHVTTPRSLRSTSRLAVLVDSLTKRGNRPDESQYFTGIPHALQRCNRWRRRLQEGSGEEWRGISQRQLNSGEELPILWPPMI